MLKVPDDFKLKQVQFYAKQDCKFYLIELGIHGSTFGANQFLIIWRENDYWSLFRTPFARASLVDVDGDGLTEFQSIYPEMVYYKFSGGALSKYIPKGK